MCRAHSSVTCFASLARDRSGGGRRAGADAFISHASKDVALATRIERLLEDSGLTVWLDRSEIRAGRLLRGELQSAIRRARVVILLWSKAASQSRWVAAEILTAFHLRRFIVVGTRDDTALPYFLENTIYLNLRRQSSSWVEPLKRAIRDGPRGPNRIPVRMASQTPELREAVRTIVEGQAQVTDRVARNELDDARRWQVAVSRGMRAAEKRWPLEAQILNLAGYHRKNAYMLKHWPAILAGRPPKDRLLERAERCFFDSLFADPNDYEALNGLGSILVYERDLDAAEFFIRRALYLADAAGVDYQAAKQDLQLIQWFKARAPAGRPRGALS
jgi:hypothetical protein